MKTHIPLLLAPATALVLLAANLTLAQDAPRRPGAAPDGARPAGAPSEGQRPPGGQREGGFRGGPGGFQPIELTEDQREAVRNAMQEHRDDNEALAEKSRDARKAYNDAVLADKADQNKVKAAAKEVADVQAEMMIVQSKIFAKIRSKLTKEQIEQIKTSPAGIALIGGMGGMGGGRPGGFGGPGAPGGQRPDGAPGARPDGQGRRPAGDADSPAQKRPSRPEAEKNK